jgi:exonuclease SbcD
MRIIHTADWHLNDKLGRVDRTRDLQARVERVAALCEAAAAHVLLIAGDLFCERASRDEVTQSLLHLRATFQPFFARGGSILAITGNHDRDHVIELVRASMGLAAPVGVPIGATLSPGRMYLFNTAWFGKLRAAGDNFDVQFIMLPYPTTSRYLAEQERRDCRNAEEENLAVQGKIMAWFKNLSANGDRYDEIARTVLAAHLSVSSADVSRGLFRLTEKDDVLLDGDSLPVWPDYVALGHIHKAQCLRGLSHVRYPGSLDRLDLGEREDQPGVVLVDLGPDGRRCEPEVFPLEPTPMYDVIIDDDTLTDDDLRALYPNADRALARITIQYRPGADSRDAIERAVRAAFPRFTFIDWRPVGAEADPGGQTVTPKLDFRETVRQYLQRRLEDDEQKQPLLDLLDRYLTLEAGTEEVA